MTCPEPKAKAKCITCPRARREVRVSLALFGLTSFMSGMLTFMFVLCSTAPHHLEHLKMLVTNPLELLDHDHDRDHDYSTAD